MFAAIFAALSIIAITYMLLYRQDNAKMFVSISFALYGLSVLLNSGSWFVTIVMLIASPVVIGLIVAVREMFYKIGWVPPSLQNADTRSVTAYLLIFLTLLAAGLHVLTLIAGGVALVFYIMHDKDKDKQPAEPSTQEDNA